MKEQITILSLNVNGLRDSAKRINFFSWLKLFPHDIILLQDTHFSPSDQTLWTQQWGLPVVWSSHNAVLSTNRSCTLSLLPSPQPLPRLAFFSASFPYHSDPIYFASIYIPAQYTARTLFLQQLPPSLPFDISFLAGDINMIGDALLDRSPPSNQPTSSQWTTFASLLQTWGLLDIHRHLCLDNSQITRWTQLPSDRIGRRIDNLFVDTALTTLFSDTTTLLCPYSDHYALTGSMLLPSSLPHGAPSWKLNTSLLRDETFQEGILQIWNNLLTQPHASHQVLWDEAKSLFQGFAVYCASVVRRPHQDLILSLQSQIAALDRAISTSPSTLHLLLIERDQLFDQLEEHLQHSFQGTRIRSRARWLESGEKPSAYFHRLMAARRTSSRISKLLLPDGSTTSEIDSITDAARSFYQNLYMAGDVSVTDQDNLLSSLQQHLTEDQSLSLEADITPAEVAEAVKLSPHNSAPGCDGLPFEFYQTFSDTFSPFLASLFNDILSHGILFPSATYSSITLIFKNRGAKEDLRNWRPISLLNCDKKLFTRIMATRLQRVITSLIHPSQTGFIKGRLIHDNTMTISQILDYCRTHNISGALVFLDQEKAYDRVNWSYLLRCLQTFGFGPRWLLAIQSLLQNLQASVLVNGFRSLPFSIQQGLPQGDPLSPLLYNIILEPLLSHIRQHLQGLQFPTLSFSNSAFADDVVVGLANAADRTQLLSSLHLHESACNAKLNLDKSEFLPLSDAAADLILPIGHSLPRDQIFTHLGIPFHPKAWPLPVGFFNSLLEKLQRTRFALPKCDSLTFILPLFYLLSLNCH